MTSLKRPSRDPKFCTQARRGVEKAKAVTDLKAVAFFFGQPGMALKEVAEGLSNCVGFQATVQV